MPPRPSRAAASAPDPTNLLLRCVQCRRPVEILLPAGPQQQKKDAAEAISRSLVSCALSSSQDLPLCTSCWNQRLSGAQQQAMTELSSLVETLSTVQGISPAAIAAFTDLELEVDTLTQQYVVVGKQPHQKQGQHKLSSNIDGGEADEAMAMKLDDEQYETERAQLELELRGTEQELAAQRREVRQLQGALSKLNSEADSIERQLNGVALQESAVQSAAQSAASRLQMAKAGFARLGMTVTDATPTGETIAVGPGVAKAAAASASASAANCSPAEKQRTEALSTSASPAQSPQSHGRSAAAAAAATADGSDVVVAGTAVGLVSNYEGQVPDDNGAAGAGAGEETVILAGQVKNAPTSQQRLKDDHAVPEGTVISASLDSLATVPTMALFTVSPSQVNFDSMNNVSSSTNLSSVLSAAFHIECEDNISRINGRRVGRLATTPVQDEEINAGCGFLSLLMNYLLQTYTRMEKTRCSMDPQGCASTITIYETNQKRTVVDFHIKRRFFSWSTFGQAWITFSNCTNEVVQSVSNALRAKATRVRGASNFAPSTASAQLVQRIDEHIGILQSLPKITQNGLKVDDDSVKYGDASDQQWTSAVRGLMRLLSWSISADKYLNE